MASVRLMKLLVVIGLLPIGPVGAGEADLPAVRVSAVRKVFDNGEHNAFTDMCRYRGRYYLTFRSCPDGHGVHPTSSIIVLASDDARSWSEVHRFGVSRRDTRDSVEPEGSRPLYRWPSPREVG